MLARLSPIDKVSIVALAQSIQKETEALNISTLAAKLCVPLMSESRNRKALVGRLSDTLQAEPPRDQELLLNIASSLISFLSERSGAVTVNEERHSYAPWFKSLLASHHEKGMSWADISRLTGINTGTLERFSKEKLITPRESISHDHDRIAAIWGEAAPYHRKSLDNFWLYLQRRHRHLALTYKEIRQILIDLGLHSLRGPKIKNHGARVKRAFDPHAMWEGDAKQIKMTINGHAHVFYWYAFVDQTTTLLVGSDIGHAESSVEFLSALRNAGDQQKTYPIGILIDNRLEGSDLGPIRSFCAEHKIELVRIYPGSSKTNGNIENNFSVFERHVGPINISGKTDAEMAKAITAVIVDVFTQQRNHTPRRRLADKTPAEMTNGQKRPENARNYIESLARRFEKENRQIEEKWQIIKAARNHFGDLDEASANKMKAELGKYPVSDLLAAQAAYVAQIVKHPDRRYGPEYFLAILRHKREEKAKGIYNETYRAGVEICNAILPQQPLSVVTMAPKIVNMLVEIQDELTPAHRMLRLDALCWWMVSRYQENLLAGLWMGVGELAEATRAMSLRWWATINEYVTDRIGKNLWLHQDFQVPTILHS